MAPDLLDLLHPSELVLRDWVAPQLDASMLKEIAQADYGVDVDEHLYALEELRSAGRLPEELDWRPQEVLRLTRWSTMDDPRLSPEAVHRRHLMRLFSCLVLVRVATADGSPVNSVTPLIESAVELGPDAVDAAAGYLAWCRLHEPGDWRDDQNSRPFLTLALVMLSSQLPQGNTPELLPWLIATFVEELSAALDEENLLWSQRPVRDLLKVTTMAENRRIWASLAGRCLLGESAQRTGHGVMLTQLGQAIRSELVADAAELRALLVPA